MSIAAHNLYQFKHSLGSSHDWAITQAQSLPRNSKVLDFGSGSGMLGFKLREAGFSEIYNVEIDSAARDATAKWYTASTDSINNFSDKKFDLILALDVLEHMPQPEVILNELFSHLAPGGVILISVPNVAHWSIRLSLLFGYFVYTKRGLLDITHFRLFTYASARKLIRNIDGLIEEESTASISPAEFVLPVWISRTALFKAFSTCRLFGARLLPGLLGYQILIKARRAR